MSTHSSPSGATSEIKFTFVGSSVDASSLTPVSLGTSESEPTPEKPEPERPAPVVPSTSSTPNTGFFTSDGTLTSAPFYIFIFVIISIIAVIVSRYRKNPHAHHDYTLYDDSRLALHDYRSNGKRLALTIGGAFSIFFLFGLLLPEFIEPTEDSASAIDNYLDVSLKSSHVSGSASLKDSSTTLALATQTITSSTSSFDLYVNVAEDGKNGNYLFLDGNTEKGYIAPTSGTQKSKKSLAIGEWGFTTSPYETAKNNGAIWSAVPLYGVISAVNKIHSTSDSSTSLTIVYGAYASSSRTPSGSFTNTVIYTATTGV